MKITDLTLEEKILQTIVLRANGKDDFKSQKAGAVFVGGEIITTADEMGIENARNLIERYIDNADIPILITSDFENGCGSMLKGLTILPFQMSLGATNNEKLAYDYGKATALDAKSIGANWTLSPVCDLMINPRNPLVNNRSIGDNAENASKLLKQIVRGMQENGLAACAKHFPGDGVDYRDQHITPTSNTLSYEEWKKTSGKVFQDLIDDGVYTVMAGHISLPCYQKDVGLRGLPLPATLSYDLITKLLKGEMGFKGVVVTDAMGMSGMVGWHEDREQTEVESFKAGCDMMLWPSNNYPDNIKKAIETGYISMERLDDAVNRILILKEKMGLFNKDNKPVKLTSESKQFLKRVQKETAEKSITLVRNEKNLLPIDKNNVKKIAVVPISNYEPAFSEAELLCKKLEEHGFEVAYFKEMAPNPKEREEFDIILFALFSRSFRPIGFLDVFGDTEATKVANALKFSLSKNIVVSFGSPYFGNQYFERAHTYINAYSMLAPSVEAFVKAFTGEIEFSNFSPVEL